jgi:hypothetical protein
VSSGTSNFVLFRKRIERGGPIAVGDQAAYDVRQDRAGCSDQVILLVAWIGDDDDRSGDHGVDDVYDLDEPGPGLQLNRRGC